MRQVAIVSDSTLDIPDELLRELEIAIAPVHVIAGGKSYRDRIDMSIAEANRLMLSGEVRLTTSGSTAEDFLRAYEEALKLAPSVVAFSISPTLSVTYRSAVTARELMEDQDITVVETKSVLASMGLVVKAAAEMARDGASRDEIVARSVRRFERVRMVLTAYSTQFAQQGGRLQTSGEEKEGTYPIFRIWEKGWREIGRATTRQEAIASLLTWMASDLEELGYREGQGRLTVAVDHIVCPDEAMALRDMVEERYHPLELHVWEIGPTAGAHLGPGSLGVAYLYDDEP
jgi:DegV family protein with EDD domain